MEAVLNDNKTQVDVLRYMTAGKNLPPWDLSQGFRTYIERELQPVPGGECRVLNKPSGMPQHFCKADVGDACQEQIDRKPEWRRPKFRLVEDVVAGLDGK